MWDWDYALSRSCRSCAKAAIVTIEATLLGFVLAATLGLVLALAAHVAFPVDRAGRSRLFVEFIRSTPLLIQIFFLYFVFPRFGITLDAFTAGVLALGIHYGAYCSEVYRAGFDNVHRGQWEASTALNLSTWTTFSDIIIPQAIPPIVPALGNYLVALFKETPLLSAIAVLELMQTAEDHRLGDLPLYRADHLGRRLLPHHEPGLRRRHPLPLERMPQPEDTLRDDRQPTDGAFREGSKRYGALTVLDVSISTSRAARRSPSSGRRARARPRCCAC